MIKMSASLSDYLAHLQSACSFSHVTRACFLLLALLNPDDDASGGREKKKRPGMILLWRSTMKEKNNKFITESGSDFHNSSGQRRRWLEENACTPSTVNIWSECGVKRPLNAEERRGAFKKKKETVKSTLGCRVHVTGGERENKMRHLLPDLDWRFFFLWSPKGRL